MTSILLGTDGLVGFYGVDGGQRFCFVFVLCSDKLRYVCTLGLPWAEPPMFPESSEGMNRVMETWYGDGFSAQYSGKQLEEVIAELDGCEAVKFHLKELGM